MVSCVLDSLSARFARIALQSGDRGYKAAHSPLECHSTLFTKNKLYGCHRGSQAAQRSSERIIIHSAFCIGKASAAGKEKIKLPYPSNHCTLYIVHLDNSCKREGKHPDLRQNDPFYILHYSVQVICNIRGQHGGHGKALCRKVCRLAEKVCPRCRTFKGHIPLAGGQHPCDDACEQISGAAP